MAASQHPNEAGRTAAPRWQRHFQGWPLAVLAVGLALTSLLLASPRRSVPDVLPLPECDPSAITQWRRIDDELAEQARRSPLPRSVRAIGDSYRVYSHGLSLGLSGDAEAARMRARASAATRAGLAAEVGRLRAVQTELFLAALTRWNQTGHRDRELDELAGDFLDKAKRSGWLDGRRTRFSEPELAALFQVRWTHLAGLLDDPNLRLSLIVWQLYYAALLRHPEDALETPQRTGDRQLAYIEALCRRDPSYPRDFGRGVLFFRAQRMADAEESFRRFLVNSQHQRWRLRARNHWLECRARQGKL